MNVIGFDDGPFARNHRGSVLLVGAVCSRTRLDGVVSGLVHRDGTNSTRRMIELVRESQFSEHVRGVLLQGIAVGGFNVVDVHELSRALGIPVLVVMRRHPDRRAVHRALFGEGAGARPPIRGAKRKWALIERAGAPERLVGENPEGAGSKITGLRDGLPTLWVQRVGLNLKAARRLVAATTLHGNIPEPLRLAHLIAGGIVSGKSRGRA